MRRICVIQASHLTWSGAPARCLRKIEGRTVLEHTIEAALKLPVDDVVVTVPKATPDILEAIDETEAGLHVEDSDPLHRVIHAAGDALITLRVDGFHPLFERTTAQIMMESLEDSLSGDCVKLPDDYPPMLACEAYRTESLRKLSDSGRGIWTHFRFSPDLSTRRIQSAMTYTPIELQRMREWLCPAYEIGRDAVIREKATPAGDQLSFHYLLAQPFLSHRDRVLEAACGTASGSELLCEHCHHVTAIDIDAGLIHSLSERELGKKLSYENADITELPYEDQTFDVVVSFETIEHVEAIAAFEEFHRVLRHNGLLILSTPQSSMGKIPLNCSHTREFSLAELQTLLHSHGFEQVHVRGLKGGRVIIPGDLIAPNTFYVGRKVRS